MSQRSAALSTESILESIRLKLEQQKSKNQQSPETKTQQTAQVVQFEKPSSNQQEVEQQEEENFLEEDDFEDTLDEFEDEEDLEDTLDEFEDEEEDEYESDEGEMNAQYQEVEKQQYKTKPIQLNEQQENNEPEKKTLVSNQVKGSIKEALNYAEQQIASRNVVKETYDYAKDYSKSSQFRSGYTLEDLAMEAMIPVIQEWLEQNLSHMVEDIVREEVSAILSKHKK